MLGFGDGEGREIEKREERQRVALLFFFVLCFFIFWFLLGFRKGFFFFNTVLTWKIVGASKASVLYIYIYILINKLG